MTVFYEGVVLSVVPVSFTNQEGELVEYNEIYFENVNEDDEKKVIVFNSKLPGMTKIRGPVVIELDMDVTGKRKPKLLSVKPKEE